MERQDRTLQWPITSYKIRISRKWVPYLFISPFFVLYGVFGLYPVLYGAWLSVHKIGAFSAPQFVGTQNYLRVLSDGVFWRSIGNAAYFLVGSLGVILPFALLLALLLNHRVVARAKGFFTTMLFTPYVTSVVVIGIVFAYLFKTSGGVLNAALEVFGVAPVSWLRDPTWAIPVLILIALWNHVGLNALYFLAGLQNIPTELYDAARIDGASGAERFFHITLPLLRPISLFIFFQAIIGSFSVFGQPFILTNGTGTGTNNSMLMPTVLLYIEGFRKLNFGYAAAVGYVLTLIMLAVTLIQLYLFRDRDRERGT